MLENSTFDVAFSFAGEDRVVVEAIYKQLSADGINVFYDDKYQSTLMGIDLYTYLRDLYKNKGKFVVCFISEHYSKKIWTNLEFTAIKERLMETFFLSDFLIPIILEEADIPEDIPGFVGYYNHTSIESTVALLEEKINSSLVEDNLMINIYNGIDYICSQICHYLQKNAIHATLENANEIIINQNGNTNMFYFSGDSITQTACILITKKKAGRQDPFPSYVLTWKKERKLLFTIHEFDGNDNKSLENKPLNQMIEALCLLLEKDNGGMFIE